MAKKSSLQKEIIGILLISLGTLIILGLSHNLGEIGTLSTEFFISLFGMGIWVFPFVLIIIGGMLIASYRWKVSPLSFLGVFLTFFSFQGILHTLQVAPQYADKIFETAKGGGMFGIAFSLLPRVTLGDTGTLVLLFSLFLIGLLLAFRLSLFQVVFGVIETFQMIMGNFPKKSKKSSQNISFPIVEKLKKEEKEDSFIKTASNKLFEIKRSTSEKPEMIKEKKEEKINRPEDQDFSAWKKPSVDLLEKGSSIVHIPDKELHEMGAKIVEKLGYFQVGTTMNSAVVGPTVTQFALEPDESVKLSRITGLKNELALALSAESVRIEAPIPGKNLVGIEIPNPKRSAVYMREILQSTVFEKASGSMRLCIGKDVSGNPIVESLDEMPHLLIAGSTGSGKSVGMNAFLISMLFENSPADLRLIMVDPKRVELMPYEGIPHLLTPVITEASKALSALRWCVAEMMRRLEEFSKVGSRNIAEYNAFIDKKKLEKKKTEEEEEKKWKHLPKIVIVIDELADLMMREHKKETEGMICRIAQMARAVGMHLVIATQRPSVDVITGLIKANIPTRIAFTVTSAVDSRTVLDCIGAEDLLGRGDMLFLNPRLSKPKRIQGIYISGTEIEKVVHHLKLNMSDEAFFEDYISLDDNENEMMVPGMRSSGSNGSEDDLMQEALEVVRSTGKASASLLQRRLSVGYARAARLLDEMEEAGYIGPSRGAKPRDIYL